MWELIKLYSSSVWGFVRPFVRMFLSKAGPILAKAALAAVRAQVNSSKTGSDKRDAAFNAIATELKQQGITIGVEVSTYMINAAIEAAVAKVKSGE